MMCMPYLQVWRPSLLIAIAPLVGAASLFAGDSLPQFAIENDRGTTRVVAHVHGCRVSLERRTVEAHLLHLRHGCKQTLDEKMVLLQAMIEMLVPEPQARRNIHTLFIGRLVTTFPELAKRLAHAAARHPDWNPSRERQVPGSTNRFVATLAREAQILTELERAVAQAGYRVQAVSVEKVLIAPAQRLPFGTWLVEQGVAPDARLPFDALTWLRLAPLHVP